VGSQYTACKPFRTSSKRFGVPIAQTAAAGDLWKDPDNYWQNSALF
jgi:hypothetical protein